MFASPKSLFRVLAFAEVGSWTLLIVGLILRATAGLDIAATIGGSIHGFVFISYGATAVLLTFHQRWPAGIGAVAIASAVIPYATVPVERWLARTGRLEGQWMLEVPAAPERRWYDGIMVWFLRRPWVFGLLIVALIVLVYVVLVTLGPPIPKN
ncbi:MULTISPECIES: DUF3817 domain-containing protein [unclassified Salinibacterium]|uniref:DUF3817 domain-containing protein n=1 Tax=unclassified Salinibacterium TaxID=2632331 RepID=UPI00141E83BE|nr:MULTISPECIES: DUF3817 domain-containing protein [unclassified Salinibacterium]